MPISRVQLNFASVGFTPTGGSLTQITRVTAFNPGLGGSLTGFAGDGDIYMSLYAVTVINPKITIVSADMATLMNTWQPGTEGVLTGTIMDAKQATGGAVNFSVAYANFETADTSASHGSFASCTASWMCRSADGLTSPFTITRS
jgi:hypothetical protein